MIIIIIVIIITVIIIVIIIITIVTIIRIMIIMIIQYFRIKNSRKHLWNNHLYNSWNISRFNNIRVRKSCIASQ